MITKSEVDAAVARIAGRVRTTPVLRVEPGPFGPGLVFKCEYTQHTGSFKARGAFNRILSAAEGGAAAGPAVGDGSAAASAAERRGGGSERGGTELSGTGVAAAERRGGGSGLAGAPASGDAARANAARGGAEPGEAADSGFSVRPAAVDGTVSGPARTAASDGSAGIAVPDATANGEGLTAAGVVAASGGNAGLAVAYAAARLGVPAVVYVPRTAPVVKVDRLRALGAEVRQVGTEFAQANEAALAHAAESGALFCHAYDQPEIVTGQGGVAVELLDQVPDVDTVLVSVGGGGLAGGIAAGLDGRARLVAVEPETIPTLHSALGKGEPVDVAVSGVAADSLGARRVGGLAFELAVRHGVHSVLVSDAAIVAARKLLWDELRIVVEHGTAAALAAVTTGAYRPAPDETVAIVLCGANTDPTDLG